MVVGDLPRCWKEISSAVAKKRETLNEKKMSRYLRENVNVAFPDCIVRVGTDFFNIHMPIFSSF